MVGQFSILDEQINRRAEVPAQRSGKRSRIFAAKRSIGRRRKSGRLHQQATDERLTQQISQREVRLLAQAVGHMQRRRRNMAQRDRVPHPSHLAGPLSACTYFWAVAWAST